MDLAARGQDRFSSYSLGMKQRLGVAAALLKDPELVVLDEPTNGLDPAMRDMRALVRSLGAEGRTVLLSSPMGEVQQICDRVGVINQGRMVAESTVAERGRSGGRGRHAVGHRPFQPRGDARGRAGPRRRWPTAGAGRRAAHRRCHPHAGDRRRRRHRGTPGRAPAEEVFFEMTEHEAEASHV